MKVYYKTRRHYAHRSDYVIFAIWTSFAQYVLLDDIKAHHASFLDELDSNK